MLPGSTGYQKGQLRSSMQVQGCFACGLRLLVVDLAHGFRPWAANRAYLL